jgi:hypothetical protein
MVMPADEEPIDPAETEDAPEDVKELNEVNEGEEIGRT